MVVRLIAIFTRRARLRLPPNVEVQGRCAALLRSVPSNDMLVGILHRIIVLVRDSCTTMPT